MPPNTLNEGALRRFTRYFNFRLFYSCAVIALSQLNFGMDQGAFSNTQAMSAFIKKFGVFNQRKQTYELKPSYLSLLNSLTYIGFAFGLVMGNFLSAKLGRKKCFLVMCGWALIGALILVTSHNRWQMVVGRIIAYVYIGMELALVPVLQSELVPAPVRGFIVGTYQSSLLLGQLIMSVICRGTSTIEGDRSWRTPLGIFFVIPSLLFCAIWYVPESPRWLLARGRREEALQNLILLRKGRYSDSEIEEEFLEYQSTLNRTVEKGRFVELFQGTNLKRTLIVVGVNIFLQLTGQNFNVTYGAIFIKSIGVVDPFTMNSVNVAVNIFFTLVTQSLTDMAGRVPLMFCGAIIQTAALVTMGGLGTVASPSFSIKAGIVAMVTIFGVGFQLGWAPLSHVVAAEVPTQHLRDQTYALGSVFNILIQFAVSFSIPYLLYEPYAALGSKVGFIFGATAACAVVFTWFCVPECSGKTLEEIDELFLEGTSIRDFKTARSTHHVQQFRDEENGSKVAVQTVESI